MRVRCPSCKQIHTDPASRFRCSCGSLLAWQEPELWLTEQMALFQPTGVGEQQALPLGKDSPGKAGTSPDSSHLPLTQRELLTEAIALVTALLAVADGGDDVVPALLADQDLDRLLALTATTGWLASLLVRQVDAETEGAGTDWLRALALGLAAD